MGQRTSNTTGVTFEDVVVPNEVSPVFPDILHNNIILFCHCYSLSIRIFLQLLVKVLGLQ